MGLFDFIKNKNTTSKPAVELRGQILPLKNTSYVVGSSGEPMVVYYREKTRLFVNCPIGDEQISYFLNIRRPLFIDVTGLERVDIPPIPSECDGIILKGYGIHQSTAFIVRDFESQTMEFPL